ncbi:MAG: hypothetical protein WDW38_011558 [Sanguina aurantia]
MVSVTQWASAKTRPAPVNRAQPHQSVQERWSRNITGRGRVPSHPPVYASNAVQHFSPAPKDQASAITPTALPFRVTAAATVQPNHPATANTMARSDIAASATTSRNHTGKLTAKA